MVLVRRVEPLIVSSVMKGSISESHQRVSLNQKTSKLLWSSFRLLAEEKPVEGAPRCGWRSSPIPPTPVSLQVSVFKLV